MVFSVTAPAGSMTQTVRGASSFLTRSARLSAPVAPSPASCRTDRGVGVIGDAAVLPALQAAHDIGAHTAQSNHAKLHSRVSLCGFAAHLLSREYPIRRSGAGMPGARNLWSFRLLDSE